MKKFALISEGITDQVVLETILLEYYENKDGEEPVVNVLQPARDATDESRAVGMGGWELALEYCTFNDEIERALGFNDFVVIQIDTDCGEHPNFGVALTKGGLDRPVPDIINDTIAVIISRIDSNIYKNNIHKFVFAIAVHSIECWLIHLQSGSHSANRIKFCKYHLRRVLSNNKKVRYEKNHECYQKLCSKFSKLRNINLVKTRDESFRLFISNLP